MSFTISQEDRTSNTKISEAIEKVEKKVLMFAPASNDGTNADRTFPAKHRNVLCIYTSNGDGVISNRNPRPQVGDLNFSALGEFVEAPHANQAVERFSGTSVATAVAAGIAALVLEFTRQPLVKDQEPIQGLKRLNTKEGMEMAFLKMTSQDPRSVKTDLFNNLQPRHLLSAQSGESASEARRRAASDINKALKYL